MDDTLKQEPKKYHAHNVFELKKKILFLAQLPPPLHGASAVNKSIQDSHFINAAFTTKYINISPAKDISDIGKFRITKLFDSLAITLKSISEFLKTKPDLIYLTLSPYGLAFYKDGLLAIILKLLGGKLVFHMHGKGIQNEAKKSWLKKTIYRSVFKDVDVIHLAESLFYDIEYVRDKAKSITAIANGIAPLDKNSTAPKSETFTFVYLSNLIRSKGADILVRAAGMIPAEYQGRFQVKIIGKPSDTQYAAEIERIIAENPYNNIKLLGPKYGQEKIKELTSSHVFVLPTRFKNECFPLSILEAMAAELAVISTNEGAIAEIVDQGESGEVLIDATPNALAEVMIKHVMDPKYSMNCAKSGLQKYLTNYKQEDFEKNLCLALQKTIQSNKQK